MAFTEDHLSLLVENLVGNCASKSYHTVAILENIFKIAQIYPVFIYPNLRYIFWVYLELDWLRGFFKFENKNTYFITWMSIFFVLNHYLCLIKRKRSSRKIFITLPKFRHFSQTKIFNSVFGVLQLLQYSTVNVLFNDPF